MALIQAWTKFGITWTSLGTDTRLGLPALPGHWASIEQLSKATPENMVEPMPGIATPDDNEDSEAETLPLPGTHQTDLESKIQAQPTPSRCNRLLSQPELRQARLSLALGPYSMPTSMTYAGPCSRVKGYHLSVANVNKHDILSQPRQVIIKDEQGRVIGLPGLAPVGAKAPYLHWPGDWPVSRVLQMCQYKNTRVPLIRLATETEHNTSEKYHMMHNFFPKWLTNSGTVARPEQRIGDLAGPLVLGGIDTDQMPEPSYKD